MEPTVTFTVESLGRACVERIAQLERENAAVQKLVDARRAEIAKLRKIMAIVEGPVSLPGGRGVKGWALCDQCGFETRGERYCPASVDPRGCVVTLTPVGERSPALSAAASPAGGRPS